MLLLTLRWKVRFSNCFVFMKNCEKNVLVEKMFVFAIKIVPVFVEM
jgi:hypothetical protein